MLDIVGKRYWFFGISLLVIVPGLIALAVWGFPLAIDFTGGSLLEVQFPVGQAPQPAEVVALYQDLGYHRSNRPNLRRQQHPGAKQTDRPE